ncbi:MAG: alpha-N-arabinofuranosidase [Bacteroidales bacterium]|nr:alpha-N-arabinofuranosidase [Bacteroidales bacterium]
MKLNRLHVFLAAGLFLTFSFAYGQADKQSLSAKMVINADLGKDVISRHIYGHFSEHLGHCIYGGYWVGEDSEIPNTNGIRNDVVEALKKINIPNLRWPGGCFADEYHWMDGIGPRSERPKMVNTHWGGVTEDNSFGTHEFLELCRQLNTEPYICGNVGSGTVEEMSKWVEYINFDGISPMAEMRKKNGQEKPWGVKYWAVGNENWGCGGNMTPEFYADQYRRYATFCRNYGGNNLLKVAGGANVDDYNWTEVLMKKIPHWQMWGLSLHHYTTDWWNKGPATGFPESRYFDVLDRCLKIEKVLDRHINIMDKYDPEKRVALVFDEWGTWYDVEPGTNPGFLFQQNTIRDALVAGISLNYMNQRCDRIKMANIAQTINVLQALIFTKDDKMLLTPTYHVFDMYKVHQDATLLPVNVLQNSYYEYEKSKLPALSVSASKDKNGAVHLTITNLHPSKKLTLNAEIRGSNGSSLNGMLLTAETMDACNTFENPEHVKPVKFNGATLKNNILTAELPAKSVVMIEIKQ